MAKRGRKPKPPQLRIVDGSFRSDRHGAKAEAAKSAAAAMAAFGKLERPKWLKGEARKAWDEYIAPATWLDGSRAPAAILFCELWAEFREAPSRMVASRLAQMRNAMADLGLTDERNRAVQTDDEDAFFS
jgi:phage terminase small subunit